MKRLLKVAITFGLASSFALCARSVESVTAAYAIQGKVMSEFKGVRLGLKREAVKTLMGNPESSNDTSDDFKLTGEDTMTVHYDNGEVKAIQLAFLDPKNAPAWKDVVGDAEMTELASGAKNARKTVDAEKFWVSFYQTKDGMITRITISKQ
ncbi:MAG: hypothetical protein ACRD9Y_04505 [Blastocatellia bacterium]